MSRRRGRSDEEFTEFAVAARAVVSVFLDASRRRSSGEQPVVTDLTVASPEDVARAVTDRAALMAALARVPQRQRACIVLRYFEDLDVRETATVLGCSEGTVKSQTARGLATLRALLESASRDELAVNRTGGQA